MTPTPCRHCGRGLRRRTGLPFCRADLDRAYAAFKARMRGTGVDAWQRAYSATFGDPDAVAALLGAA